MSEKTFKLGLCMAGAISAGAYSAGVLDYLFETLQKWEDEKERIKKDGISNDSDKSIPMHNVVIEALNGTSAGGMCAAIAANELLCDAKIDFGSKGIQNRLYDAWVNLNDNVGRGETILQMLSNSDIYNIETSDINCKEFNQKKGVRALFNSDFITEICQRIITQKNALTPSRKYVSENLDIAVTVSNLRAIPYSIIFNQAGNELKHKMPNFSHYLHFNLKPALGASSKLFDPSNADDIKLLQEAAMATGAFPVGLESRATEVETQLINQIKFPVKQEVIIPECNKKITIETLQPIKPDWSYGIGNKLNILCVDGGMVNNEPFNLTHKLLLEKTPGRTHNPRSKDDVDSAVIMIDPFPNYLDKYPLDYKYSKKLMPVIGQIFSALRNQPLFRQEDVELTLDEKVYSRYLIVPSRSIDEGHEDFPIACGSLGGFGGFLDKSFREHDFQLGRRNCQRFIRRHFAIPADNNNPIFAECTEEAKKRFTFTENGIKYMPIIPDLNIVDENEEGRGTIEPLPTYPVYNKKEKFPDLKHGISNRLFAVIYDVISDSDLFGSDSSSFLEKTRTFLLKIISIILLFLFMPIWLPIYFIIRNKIIKGIVQVIEDDLIKHNLIENK